MPRVAALTMLFVASVPALAGEGFYNGHLLPRLNRHLGSVPAIRPLAIAGDDASGQAVYEYVLESARHRAERSARKAIKSYLLEATSLDHLYRALRGERESLEIGKQRKADCGVRISHGAVRCPGPLLRPFSPVRFLSGPSAPIRTAQRHRAS